MFVGGFAVAFSNLEELEVDTLVTVATLPPMAFAFAILNDGENIKQRIYATYAEAGTSVEPSSQCN